MNKNQHPTPFLRQVVLHYLNAPALARRTFIFPSKRAEKFFLFHLSELAKEMGKPIFAPKTTTVNDFILSQKPEYQVLDKTELLFRLYDCRTALQAYTSEDEEQSLEDFLFWGNIILSDFDLIDRNLVDAYQLYRNIEGLKELEDIHLNFLDEDTKHYLAQYLKGFVDNSKMTDEERDTYRRRFLHFWQSLYDLYLAFRHSLKDDNETSYAYEGYVYRTVAEDKALVDSLKEHYIREIEDEGIAPLVFVGLFELSQSELAFFHQLRQAGLAEFFWDREVKVIQDHEHPASRILNKQIDLLKAVRSPYHLQGSHAEDSYLPREVKVYETASTITQVKALSQILSDAQIPRDIRSAIVLPDEQLLIPTVSSIPDEYDKLNITLGYPLNRTSVSTLINRWLRLLPTNYKGHYTIPNIVNLLSLQLLTEFYPGLHALNTALRKQRNYTLSGKWIVEQYLPHLAQNKANKGDKQLSEEILRTQEILTILLIPHEDAIGFLDQLDKLLELIALPMIRRDRRESALANGLEESETETISDKEVKISFDLNFLMHYQRLVRRLRGLVTTHQYDFLSREGAVQLLEGLSRNHTIPFKGNPLEGLQIMGLLESRSLHFPYLIYLTAHEGKLPKRKHSSTFIPHILRYAYKLPSPEYNEAAESYRFYQAIAQSEKLILLTGQENSLGGKAEVSRYITQMEKLYNVNIKRITVDMQPNPKKTKPIIIHKDADPLIRERLNSWLSTEDELIMAKGHKALSASRLNKYLQCPLRFYLEDIKGIQEDDNTEELLSASAFGTILHNTLGLRIYNVKPYTEISEAYIRERILSRGKPYIRSLVRQSYEDYFSQVGHKREINSLDEYNIELITESIMPILEYDASHAPFTYLYSEVELHSLLSFEIEGNVHYARFKGYVDRLDEYSDATIPRSLRIIDYKTGADNLGSSKTTIDTLFEKPSTYKACIQTLLYCELLLTGQAIYKDEPVGAIPCNGLNLRPGIVLTRQVAKNGDKYNPSLKLYGRDVEDYRAVRDEYLKYLRLKLSQLFDDKTPFVQAKDTKVCSYCPFKSICQR